MRFEFDSEIKRLEGKIKWSVFYFPYPVSEYFGTGGNIPVRVTVDGYEFDHMLLPSKNGHYMVYNEFIRRAVGKDLGDTVHVTLERDDRKRELALPAYIEDALSESGALEKFLAQPDYMKREQINYIEVAKKDETRLNRLSAMIGRLNEK